MSSPILKLLLFIAYFIVLLSLSLCAQNKVFRCNNANQVVIDAEENVLLLSDSTHHLIDTINNRLLLEKEQTEVSFWYKIDSYIPSDITMNITSSDTNDIYNFFVYKDPKQGNFCTNLLTKNIIPIRANLITQNIGKEGIGLGFRTNSKNTIIANNSKERLYNQNFHEPIFTNSGDTYYLNVYKIRGKGCGHQLSIMSNKNNLNLRLTDKTCFYGKINSIPVKKPILPKANTTEKSIVEPPKNTLKSKLTVTGQIIDNASKSAISGKVTWYDPISNIYVYSKTDSTGFYRIKLEGQLFYSLQCEAVGYEQKEIKFMRQSLLNIDKKIDFHLKKLESGNSFVLNDILFYPSTYAFKTESNEQLKALLDFLQKNIHTKIEIQGHTNGKGIVKKKKSRSHLGPEWNFQGNEKKLSKARAESVKDYLVKNGIDSKRLFTKGLGDEKMLYPKPKNKLERDKNKRVEIVLL